MLGSLVPKFTTRHLTRREAIERGLDSQIPWLAHEFTWAGVTRVYKVTPLIKS